MKLLSLGIASIVDANTGVDINRHFLSRFGTCQSVYAQYQPRTYENFLQELFMKAILTVKQYIEASRAQAQERKNIGEVKQMSKRMLKDVGLTPGDVAELELGITSLDTLNLRRIQIGS